MRTISYPYINSQSDYNETGAHAKKSDVSGPPSKFYIYMNSMENWKTQDQLSLKQLAELFMYAAGLMNARVVSSLLTYIDKY